MKTVQISLFVLLLLLFGGSKCLDAQTNPSYVVSFEPHFDGQPLVLGQPYALENGDSFAIETLRFYISDLHIMKGKEVVFADPEKYALIDLEIAQSLQLRMELPADLDFDRIVFQLGIDSLTNGAGAQAGVLDPTQGMYWAWQSGYINLKMEGKSAICPARNHVFQYHLGGFLPPFYALQVVDLAVPEHKDHIAIGLELNQVLRHIDLRKTYEVMRPCENAVGLSQLFQSAFVWIP